MTSPRFPPGGQSVSDYDASKEVIRMATDKQLKQAITAVEQGVATQQQKEWAAAAAKQAGSTGNLARKAFKGK